MQKDLMELVNSCSVTDEHYYKTDENLEQASQLERLGFADLSHTMMQKITRKQKLNDITKLGYLKITPDKIKAYLEKKVELYNREYGKPSDIVPQYSGVLTNETMNNWMANNYQTYNEVAEMQRRRDMARQFAGHDVWLRREAERQRREMQFSGVDWNVATIDEPVRIAPYQAPIQQILGSPRNDRQEANKTLPSRPLSSREMLWKEEMQLQEIKSRGTCHASGYEGIGQFIWNEVPIRMYSAIPPQDVLQTLDVHKSRNLFDYFTIASVKTIPDPLLLGRLIENEDRFFIAQWGNDIALEDVL